MASRPLTSAPGGASHPVIFTTKSPYSLPSQNFLIPSVWKRYQLPQLINKALSSQTDTIDFLVHGEGRRGLARHARNRIFRVYATTAAQDDVAPRRLGVLCFTLDVTRHFLTAAHDGHIRLFDFSQIMIRDVPAHLAPVTSVCVVPSQDSINGSVVVVSPHEDLARAWHDGTVSSTSISPPPHVPALIYRL
ncbi:hypothetical protein BDN67DRAFT_823322 [Paxillus ammoniavirescens]|nr:hypothetical protein BDN67DRAFT_823322 [Paxillus ammoniavirescens]